MPFTGAPANSTSGQPPAPAMTPLLAPASLQMPPLLRALTEM